MEMRSAIDPRVLIVEDEPRMRELLQRAVASWGFTADVARSGEEALRMLEAQPREIIMLDLNLPGMSGIEMLEKIRQAGHALQVIILTGFGDLESARKAIHLDVVEFLTKPCHLGELEAAFDRAKRRLLDQAELPTIDDEPAPQPPDAGDATTLQDVERQHILSALARHEGNRSATAAELGISLRTLYYRLSEYQKQGYQVD